MRQVGGSNSFDDTLDSIFVNYDSEIVDLDDKLFFSDYFSPHEPSLQQRIARLSFQAFSNNVSPAFRLACLKPLRLLRNTTKKQIKSPAQCSFNMLVRRLNDCGLIRREYDGYPAALCLSYDVDQKIGYNYLDEIINILLKYQLDATFNILTDWEYQVDWKKISDLNTFSCFEIGLHGGKHDVALGFRSRETIRKELEAALSSIPFEVKSYRAPALCMSQALMDVIEKLSFTIDSSLPMTNMYYKSVDSCYPFKLPDNSMWELPVTIQDSTLFLDLKLSEDAAIGEMKQIIDDVVALKGVAVLNLHPYIAVRYPRFHNSIVEYISTIDQLKTFTQTKILASIGRGGNT
jgi:hypothetical protein